MRYGVLSDIHGNLAALEACLALLGRNGVDRYLCAGDLVGYGPHPNECVATMAELPGAVSAAGNHDLIAVGRLPSDGIGRLARLTLEWTRSELRPDSRVWLERLPLTAAVDDVVIAHGSLEDPRRYVTTAALASRELASLADRHPGARLLVIGHTHRATAFGERSRQLRHDLVGAFALDARQRWLINPGAVGQSRERGLHARVAIVDLQAGRVTFHRVAYDVDATQRALRRAGLPPSSIQLRTRRPRVTMLLARLRRAGASRAR